MQIPSQIKHRPKIFNEISSSAYPRTVTLSNYILSSGCPHSCPDNEIMLLYFTPLMVSPNNKATGSFEYKLV
jgi:hypothetical protein